MESLTIREIIQNITSGEYRIPAFQRGFVWEPDNVAFLMDSIYKGYPFGALLFWHTRERLNFDRDLGPFSIPEPKDGYPIFYVLDGQQRITSIFGAFQHSLDKKENVEWKDIYFDFTKTHDTQETLFFALQPDQVDHAKHFPINTIFDAAKYRSASKHLSESDANIVDEMLHKFIEARIPVQTFRTEERSAVATIFERINRQGVRLDTLQLLSAWTWSEDFQLSDKFNDLSEDLAPFGFGDVGSDGDEDGTNLILRCCAAILADDADPDALMSITGTQIRDHFDMIVNGIKGAVDYLKAEHKIARLSNLPFTTLIVPLSVFFAIPGEKQLVYTDEQRVKLNQWFWRSCFSKRYSSGTLRNLKLDIVEAKKLREGTASSLGNFRADISTRFFTENDFGITKVNTKTFILLLSTQTPRTFISGAVIDLSQKLKQYNKAEFHHMMPKAYLADGNKNGSISINCLANFCFLSRADNNKISSQQPSSYRDLMPTNVDNILEGAVTTDILFRDEYQPFIEERSGKLLKIANELCGN